MLDEKGRGDDDTYGVTKKKPAEQKAAVELVRLAQEQSPSVTVPDGLA